MIFVYVLIYKDFISELPFFRQNSVQISAGLKMFSHLCPFALDAQTANCLAICPVCGYSHLEEEDCEIQDCPICDAFLSGEASRWVVDPDTP